jgi:hypothetical protein
MKRDRRSSPGLLSSQCVSLAGNVISSEIGGDVVALNVERGVCYGLSDVGARVWRLIATPIRVADVCATLRDEYDVDAATCQAEVNELLRDMIEEGIVIVLPEAACA